MSQQTAPPSDRPAELQALARALSHAISAEDVGSATLAFLLPATGAVAGALVQAADAGDTIAILATAGAGEAMQSALHAAVEPTVESIASSFAVERIPCVVIPISTGIDVARTALVLTFAEEPLVENQQHLLLATATAQCAIALERAAAFARERASRDRLELALDAAMMGTWEWDLRTGRMHWTPQLEAVHGFAPGAFGTSLEVYYAQIHPDDLPRVRGAIDAALEQGHLRLEYRARWPEGALHWYEARGRLIRDSRERPIALRGVCMDVTERRSAENAVRESQALFQTLADNVAQLAWMADPTGARYWFNQRWYDYTGTSLDEVQGWGWTTVHHPDHVERVRSRLKDAWAAGVPWEDTHPLRSRSGDYRWFLSRAHPIRDEAGTIVRWFGTNTDITESRWREALLVGERDALDQIARGAPLEVVLRNLCLTVEQLSEDGLLASILLLDEDGTHLHVGAAPNLPEAYNRAIDGLPIGPTAGSCGTAAYRGERVVVSDIATDPLWIDFRDVALPHGLRACWSTPIKAPGGTVLGTFALYHGRTYSPTVDQLDLAESVGRCAATIIGRKRIEAERARLYESENTARVAAESAITARDEFIAVVAHDLRNPLTAIKMQLQMDRRRMERGAQPTPDQMLARLDAMDSSITTLAHQIDELHDVTLLQVGRALELHHEPTDLVVMLRDCVARHQVTSAVHQLRVETSETECIATCDASRLERVFSNLLSNAIKYSPSGGEVLVRLTRHDAWAEVCVSDHGIGIPSADITLIFERFGRASNVDGRMVGSGLGLAGARDIVHQHGGTIAVQSEEGRGSAFFVRIPL
jgi:PAS domain S-box-containing protein